MADTVTLDPGTGGAVIATDDAGAGGHVQINKLAISADGSATVIPADATNGLDVDVTRVQGTVTVNGSGVTQPVSAASLPLPAGAATAAKQPALGTAGTAASDVISIQGIASMTAVKTDGSGVTQPVSGTVTANVGTGTMPVSNAGTFVTQENGSALTSLQLLDDTIVADDAAFTVGTTKVSVAGFLADQAATDSVNEGDAGAARMTLDRKQIVTISPSADTEGLDVGPGTGAKQISAASTNATSVKASAGKVFGWYLYNDGALEAYLKLYNKATAPTVGTDVPVVVIPIPAGAAANVEFTQGIAFATGIATALTTGFADADTGAVAAGQVIVNLFYK